MPPETNWGRLDHNALTDRATVSTPASDLAAPPSVDDGLLYGELSNPAAPAAHGWSPPTPPAPTEAELRQRLAEALEIEAQAGDLLDAAHASHERAEAHLKHCTEVLHVHDGLDDRIARDLTAQLTDGDRHHVGVDPVLNQQVAERELARVAFAAATRALENLARDLVTARGRSAEAGVSVDRLVVAILGFTAETIAERHEALLAEAGRVRDLLIAYDQFGVNRGGRLSSKVRNAMGGDMQAFARRHDKGPWIDAAAALRANPDALVTVQAG